MKILIVYYSRGGTTKKMAEIVKDEIAKQEGMTVELSPVEKVAVADLSAYDGVIVGSPTYYGTCCAQIKEMFDKSVTLHGRLDGVAGAAFASSANIGGGNETALFSIIEAMLIHGMIVQGDPKGDHYGPVAVGEVDARVQDNLRRLAQRFVALLKKVRT